VQFDGLVGIKASPKPKLSPLATILLEIWSKTGIGIRLRDNKKNSKIKIEILEEN